MSTEVTPGIKTEEKCIFVFNEPENPQKCWEAGKEFLKLGAAIDRTGWYVPMESKDEVESICAQYNLIHDETTIKSSFEDLNKNNHIILLEERLEAVVADITHQASKMGIKWDINDCNTIEYFSEKEVRKKIINDKDGSKLLNIIARYKQFNNNLRNAKALRTAEKQTGQKTIVTANNLIENQEQRLSKYRGKDFIGLPQKTLPTLDNLMLGLRGLILLTAAPNVGKTALTIQIGLDIIKHNPDACLLLVSLEMSKEEIIDRMRCHLTPMTYKTLYFGSTRGGERGWFNANESDSLDKSKKELAELGKRILILDEDSDGHINAEKIIHYSNNLKKKTGCTRVLVIIDYLQVFPIPESMERRLRSDNDVDKYRMSQMKKLRRALNNDPLIVISESRKPSGSESWNSGISDVLGSARNIYGVDAALFLNPLSDDQWAQLISDNKKIDNKIDEEAIEKIRKDLKDKGVSIVNLSIGKGRDGMEKGSFLMQYSFRINSFKEFSTQNPDFLGNYPNMEKQQNKKLKDIF